MTAAMNKIWEGVDAPRLWDENQKLRAALNEIANMHKGDQPAAINTSDLAWADRHILTMRLFARDALKSV